VEGPWWFSSPREFHGGTGGIFIRDHRRSLQSLHVACGHPLLRDTHHDCGLSGTRFWLLINVEEWETTNQ
jgi:hypothetical protein